MKNQMTKYKIAKAVGKIMLNDGVRHPIRSTLCAVYLGAMSLMFYNYNGPKSEECPGRLEPARTSEYVNPYSVPERQWKMRHDGESTIVERFPIHPSRLGGTILTDKDGDGTVDTHHWIRPFNPLTRDANEYDQKIFERITEKI